MPTLRERLSSARPVTIEILADHVREHVESQWRSLLEAHWQELHEEFDRHADAAYAQYGTMLLKPIREEFRTLEAAGVTTEPALPGQLKYSVEPASPPEERVRSFWYVVSKDGAPALGTLIFRLFHDHTRFRVWRAPEVLSLRETGREAVVVAISRLEASA